MSDHARKQLRKQYWGPHVKTQLLLQDEVASAFKEAGSRGVEEICYDLFLLVLNTAGTELLREHVYHTHDEDDLQWAFEFWRVEVEHSPPSVRGVEAVKVTRALQRMALKTDEEPIPTITRVVTSERNHG